MSNEKSQALVQRANGLFNSTERRNAEELWSVISEYVTPNQSGIYLGETGTTRTNLSGNATPGAKKTQRLFDSTAIQANGDLSSAIHSTLTNPATKWSKIRFKGEDLNNNTQAVRWLDDVNNAIHAAINESNFDTEIAKNYKTHTSLGNMALLHESFTEDDDFTQGFRFKAIHLSELVWEENKDGRVDTAHRKFELTAKQVVEKFGPENVPAEVLEKAESKPSEPVQILHVVMPRKKSEIKINELGFAAPQFRPFASMYIAMKGGEMLQEGGYYEFPYHIVRWETLPGEIYGRGPGHNALPDIRTINRAKELALQAAAKSINPPLLAQQRDILSSLDMRPGSVNVLRDINGVKPLDINSRFDVTQFTVEDLKSSIKSLFFLDKLLLPPRTETGEMTATEIQIRTEQMQRVLGPTLGRLNAELLSPLIVRCFKIMLRSGAFPPVPDIIKQQGLDVEIVFVNSLARSQQFSDITNILGWANETAQIAQIDPNASLRFDADAAVKHIAKVRGIPEDLIRNDDEIEEITKQIQEQQQQAAALEAGVQMADIQSKTQQ